MKRRDMLGVMGAALGGAAIGWRPDRVAWAGADWKEWRVDGARVNGWLGALSKVGRNPEGGVTRVGFTDADIEGRGYAMEALAGFSSRRYP
jgi:hypothetical protein